MSRRYRSSSISIDVAVSEVIGAIDDELLVEEVKARDLEAKVSDKLNDAQSQLEEVLDLAREALTAFREGRGRYAVIVLERAIAPKFKSVEACRLAYEVVATARQS